MIAAVLTTVLALGALFDVQTVPLPNKQARVFLAQMDADSTADVCVLSKSDLTWYGSAASGAAASFTFPPGASAFDIADLDADGHNEIIAICGDQIVRYAIPAPGESPGPAQPLFTLHTQFSSIQGSPTPTVLVIPYENRPVLALPCDDTLELRTADGSVAASYPIGAHAPKQVSYRSPFRAWGDLSNSAGPPGSLELQVDSVRDFVPDLPAPLLPFQAKEREPWWRRSMNGIGSTQEDKQKTWWWIPLLSDGSRFRRVVYSFNDLLGDTSVRICDTKSAENEVTQKDMAIGSERRYPGRLVYMNEDMPDFNHDGFTDLILWQSPEPGLSVDSLTRALTGGVWVAYLSVHLFDPNKNRYESKPAARLSYLAPVVWFIMWRDPVQNAVFRDFNGDGRTDFGAATARNAYSVWLYGDNGFSRDPDFSQGFPEDIESVHFRADLDGKGCTSIGLRTEKAVYLLHAVPPKT